METEADMEIEIMRMVSQNMRQELSPCELKMLFAAIDERERLRRVAVRMGLIMAEALKERDDKAGSVARLFVEMFESETRPRPSFLDSLPDPGSEMEM